MIGRTISHYKILEELGGGGMGIVYKAEDIKLKRNVALKFLPQDLTRDKTAKQRFIKEAQTASSLDHPNICNIHEIEETDDGQLFICMACYEGETLKKIIEKGQIKIDCVEEDGFWKFSVADNGPGIEEKHYERIFQMFQVLSVRDKPEGTGVGLTIVKKIAEMCGGTIWVESQVGKGSTFFFTLPKKRAEANHAKLEANTTR